SRSSNSRRTSMGRWAGSLSTCRAGGHSGSHSGACRAAAARVGLDELLVNPSGSRSLARRKLPLALALALSRARAAPACTLASTAPTRDWRLVGYSEDTGARLHTGFGARPPPSD
ncbi:unnamed protein product, partial [Prorocentrum cordatum]